MKKLLFLLLSIFLTSGIWSFGQDISPLPSITVKKLVSPNVPVMYYNTADSAFWVFKGETGWLRLATNSQLLRYYVPYNNALRDVNLGNRNIASTQQNLPINVGVVVMPTHVKNGDGTITLGSNGTYNFAKSADGSTGISQKVVVSGTTITLTDNTVNFVYVDYNGGSPVYATSLDNMIFKDDFTKVPIIRATREGTAVHFEEYDLYGLLLANKLMVKDVYLNGGRRLSGLILSTAATRISTISAGSSVFAVQYYDNMAANISGTAGSLYEYYLSSGVWNRSLVTSYDAIYYSDGTNRQLLGNNKWVAKYYFRDIGDDNEAYYVHGHEYNNKSDAVNELIPAIPPIMAAHSVYVGKIVVEKNALNGTAYPRVWEGAVQNEGTSDHSDLSAESLVWGNSGHTGTVNNLASFDGTGVASYTPNNSTNWNTAYTHSQNDTDLSPANEIQTLSTDGSAGNISISSGNTITLNVNDHTNRTALDNVSGVNTGDNATNTTSNSYADSKVQDTIVDGVTTIAPSQNAVYDALANKVSKVTSTDNAIARFDGTGGSIQNSGAYLFDSGNFYVGSNTENSYSRMLVYGGTNGANLDIRGEAGTFTDQATVEVMGNDYDTTTRSAYLQYKGSTHTGTTLGYSNANLSQLVMNGDNNLIYSSLAKPIIFGTNNQRSGMLDVDGELVLDNLASASSSIVIASTAGELNKAIFTTIGNSGAATFTLNNLNIPNYTLEGLGGEPKLNGTGFVKASGTTISYDNSTYEPAFSKNTAFNKNFGTTTGTVLEGRTFGTAANNNTGDFILNQNSSAQSANMWINGTGKFGGNVSILSSSVFSGYVADAGDGTGTGGGFSRYATDGINKLLIGTETSAYGGISGGGIAFVYDNYPFHIATNSQRRFTVTGDGFAIFSSNTNSITNNGVDRVQVDGSINTTGYRKDSTPLLLDWLKSGSAPASGNIVVGNGTTTNPSGVSVNQAIGGNALTLEYLPYWDGSKLANSYLRMNTLLNRIELSKFAANSIYVASTAESGVYNFSLHQNYAEEAFWLKVGGSTILKTSGYNLPTSVFLGVHGNENVIKLTNNNVALSSLSGSGTRLVSATSDGTLSDIINGAEGQVLKMDGGIPKFVTDSGGGLSVTPYAAPSNSNYTLDLNTYINSRSSTNTNITITLSNLDDGETGNIEVTYAGAAVVTFVVDSSYTINMADNIWNTTTTAYIKSVTVMSSGTATYSYYRSGNNVKIHGTQYYQ